VRFPPLSRERIQREELAGAPLKSAIWLTSRVPFSVVTRTAKIFPRKVSREDLLENLPNDYGEGVEVAAGLDSVVVVVVEVEVSVAGVAVGFTTVVLVSVLVSAGEAAGAAVSVFCSQAARSAALARMQIYFFIV
jgi:hypothetical protein